MKTNDLRTRFIKAEVKALRDFGYPQCDEINVLTDLMYASFFDEHLKEAQTHNKRDDVAKVLTALRTEIAANLKKAQS